MKQSIDTKKTLKVLAIAVHIIVLIHMLLYMWTFHVITPYQDWHLEAKYFDYEKISFMKIAWFAFTIGHGLLAVVSRLYSKVLFIVELLLSQFCIIYSCLLLTL